ncbi:phage protein NinX family protein [Pseudomonas syringae pv. aptata]|uniref:phage protein NinX family protein n=1 Tax=Pseudomonas syringae TaxID=317 RepID=UPI001BDCB8F6|nr:DUF2591 domain-containing protein [Pseudomonas syringae pv. aptata]
MSELVEVKTPDLVGTALDWAVAKVEGVELALVGDYPHVVVGGRLLGNYRPSTNWSQCGPLIEKYKPEFEVNRFNDTVWARLQGSDLKSRGETHLIAACRAIVALVLGETVSVPKELLS